MAHPIKEMAKMTTRSKQIDGMGFGGIAADNLAVAGALGMRNPDTRERLPEEAYQFARLIYCGDTGYGYRVRARINAFCQQNRGRVGEVVALKIGKSALKEFVEPKFKTNKKTGEPERVLRSNYDISKDLKISHKSFGRGHETLYNRTLQLLCQWSGEAINHIRLHLDDAA